MIRYATVCSGIEAPSVAWHKLGWEPVFFSEIEPFPCAVLAHHYPGVPNLGDLNELARNPPEVGRVDVLCGGTPCQSFSVAGLRGGLRDPRGNLALAFVQLAAALRAKWVVWENVPGVLSSNGGRDFGSILGALAECGYGWAYRVLDAQYFGVPQRRRRVILVGCLGDWRSAAAVLFEREGLRGNPPPGRAARQEVADGVAGGAAVRGRAEVELPTTAGTLCCNRKAAGSATSQDAEAGMLVPVAFGGNNTRGPIDVATACRAKGGTGHGDFESETFLVEQAGPFTFDEVQVTHPENRSQPQPGKPCHTLAKENAAKATVAIAFSSKDSGADAGELAPTLRAGNHDQSHANGGAPPAVAIRENDPQFPGFYQTGGSFDPCMTPDGSPAVKCGSGHGGTPPAVAYSVVPESGQGADLRVSEVETAPALPASSEAKQLDRGVRVVQPGWCVRRLTVTECERLQGFPDGYTLVEFRGKPASDSVRYKAIGNSMAVPVMRWVAERIQMVEDFPY